MGCKLSLGYDFKGESIKCTANTSRTVVLVNVSCVI